MYAIKEVEAKTLDKLNEYKVRIIPSSSPLLLLLNSFKPILINITP